MRYSPEALTAFVEAVDSGSFSAAARRLRKSQSTISTAIANLEADLGVILFDRATRQPTLTPQGEQVLSYVKAILAASERLDELAVSLSGETEPRLTFVLSDTLHPDVLEDLLVQFDRRFPHTEFECLIYFSQGFSLSQLYSQSWPTFPFPDSSVPYIHLFLLFQILTVRL